MKKGLKVIAIGSIDAIKVAFLDFSHVGEINALTVGSFEVVRLEDLKKDC